MYGTILGENQTIKGNKEASLDPSKEVGEELPQNKLIYTYFITRMQDKIQS
jgi:hypothetical protein